MSYKKECSYTKFDCFKACHTWTIEKFSLFNGYETSYCLSSNYFDAYNECSPSIKGFRLELYKNNTDFCVRVKRNNYISNCFKAYISISILNTTIKKCIRNSFSEDTTISLVSANELFDKTKVLLPEDKLIIRCEMFLFFENYTILSIKIPECELATNFADVLNSEEFTDATIVTKDNHEIPVHKVILSARSKVFAAMFKNPMEESRNNRVIISDFNHEVVKELLNFIYTGKAPQLKDVVEDLLVAADKYDLGRLKAMCLKYLSDNLSIETAALTFVLASLYNEDKLKLKSINFIKTHENKVMNTSDWRSVLTTHKNALLEAFVDSKLIKMIFNTNIN